MAKKMLEEAVSLSQWEHGYIIDSLGWAYYRLGDFEKSWQVMVEAVIREPSNALITEHLGDSFARAHRMRGAKHQWQRALDLALETQSNETQSNAAQSDAVRIDALRKKIANGLIHDQDNDE